MLPIQQFIAYVKKHQLFSADKKILLAVSGGKDSVLMAHLFKEAGFNFGIAHCNFNLRGAESQRDEAFVKLLAKDFGVQFHVIHFHTESYAENNKLSIQMAARELRYNWFEQICKEHSYEQVALAQHQNDAIETLLINLIRGTGISGLHGILPKRDRWIRPMLFLNSKEIKRLFEENKLAFVEDSSNLSDKYARNKLRLNVIPHLKAINPNLEETFMQNIERFSEVEILLKLVVEEKRNSIFRNINDEIYIAIEEVKKLKPQKLLFYEMLRPYGFNQSVVHEIITSLQGVSGKIFLSDTHRLLIDRNDIIIHQPPTFQSEVIFIQSEGNFQLAHQYRLIFQSTDEVYFEKSQFKAYIDYDKLIFPLTIRYKRAGDKFIPLGMKSFKKLSNFFVDEKISVVEKKKIPLLINGNGEIIWVMTYRTDNRYKITNKTTKTAIFDLIINEL